MREGLIPRRLAGVGTLGLVLGLLLLVSGVVPAGATHPPQVCPSSEQGHPAWMKVDGSTGTIEGEWGRVTWSGNTVSWDINEGWTVDICVKTGGNQGLNVDKLTVIGPDSDSKTYEYEISHVSVRFSRTRASSTTSSSTTTTEGEVTATTEADETTTTTEAEDTTTTTEATTTTTTVAAEVLPTVATTSTTTVVVEAAQVTTTRAAVVAETLPFTGPGGGSLAGLGAALMTIGGLMLATVRLRKRWA
jgi:hypothetical protein